MLNLMPLFWAVLFFLFPVYVLGSAVGLTATEGSLKHYNVDSRKTTISGISAGAFAAVQYHVAYSSEIIGAGIIAGGPFYCAQENLEIALSSCMKDPSTISVKELQAASLTMMDAGTIDNLKDLSDHHVYLVSGNKDSVVHQGVMKKLNEYYQLFVKQSNIKTDFDLPAEHSWITKQYGNACDYLGDPYINNCNFDAAGEFLQHFYGNSLNSPVAMKSENLLEFSQSDFIPETLISSGLAEKGFVYVPTSCQNGDECWLHVSLHGCLMGVGVIGNKFAKESGLNEWAEANNIIILYPQAKASTLNPNGCWDWWGYTGPAYPTQEGVQNLAIHQMVHQIIGNSEKKI